MAGRPPPPRYLQLRTATRGEPDRGLVVTICHDRLTDFEARLTVNPVWHAVKAVEP